MNRRLYFGPKELDQKVIATCEAKAIRLQQIWISYGTSSLGKVEEAIAQLSKNNPSVKNWSWGELQKFGERDIAMWGVDIFNRWGIGKGELEDSFFDLEGIDLPFDIVYHPTGNTRLSAAIRVADMLGYMDLLGMFVLYE